MFLINEKLGPPLIETIKKGFLRGFWTYFVVYIRFNIYDEKEKFSTAYERENY